MNTDQKISALQILTRMPFKNKGEKEAQKMLIDSIKKELIPEDSLPLILTEVYRDAPHVQTTHKSFPEVMDRVEAIRKKDKLHSIHVTQGKKTLYTWSIQ